MKGSKRFQSESAISNSVNISMVNPTFRVEVTKKKTLRYTKAPLKLSKEYLPSYNFIPHLISLIEKKSKNIIVKPRLLTNQMKKRTFKYQKYNEDTFNSEQWIISPKSEPSTPLYKKKPLRTYIEENSVEFNRKYLKPKKYHIVEWS